MKASHLALWVNEAWGLIERSKVNKLTKLGKHASGVHFAKIHFG